MIYILRIGHRLDRDKRVTTHVALVARAFGAAKMYLHRPDKKIEQTIARVCERFGGTFTVESCTSWRKIINEFSGKIVHLTMYGLDIRDVLNKIPHDEELLIIVGSEKVPAEIYKLANYNVSVGNQPHSEVSALAVFLDRYLNGSWLDIYFNGKIKIIPSENGKIVSRESGLQD